MSEQTNAEERERGQENRGRRRGPRTPAGIARSCMNALKYGEFVRDIINAKERKTARGIRKALYEQFPAPRNAIVQGIVEELVVNRLRKQRLNDRFRHELTIAVQTASLTSWEQVKLREAEPVFRHLDIRNGANFDEFDRMPPGECAKLMRTLKEKVEARGPVPAEDISTINCAYGRDESERASALLINYERLKKLLANLPGGAQDPSATDCAEIKKKILTLLDDEIGWQEELSKQDAAFQFQSVEADVAAMPPDSSWDRYFRIAAALDREFDQGFERARRFSKPSSPASA